MKPNWRNLLLSVGVVLIAAVSFVTGGLVGWVLRQPTSVAIVVETPEPTPVRTPATTLAEQDVPEELREQFETFWQVWALVEDNFFDPERIDYQKMIYGALQGMVNSLDDPYTFFSTPAETEVERTHLQSEYQGIGAYIDQEEGYPMILGPVHDETPAAMAGLRLGDLIVEVNGEDIFGLSLAEQIGLIKGPAGTDVTLLIYRPSEDESFEVTITRARIELRSAEGQMRDDGLAYISVSAFGDSTIQELDAVLEELLPQNPKGVIVDLRGNGGGYLLVAQEVLGRFISTGVAVYQESGDGTRIPHPVLGDGPEAFDVPVVVLVNGGSASASEVVAGALQDYERALIIGEQTFGKGSIQNIFDLADGSSVRITVAKWLTPDGRQIQDEGITPDLIVPLTPEDYDAGLDPQLDAAAAYLLDHPLPQTAVTPAPQP